MRWVKVLKVDNPELDVMRHKSETKEHIRQEASSQCVYCGLPENRLGGVYAFHIEHYRPKKHFPELEFILKNLYYACLVCNGFKSSTWPNDPDKNMNLTSYPDPAEVNYEEIYVTDHDSGTIKGKNCAARYVAAQLYLNRPQLTMERREDYLREKITALKSRVRRQINSLSSIGSAKSSKYVELINSELEVLDKIEDSIRKTPMYTRADVQRDE